MTYAYDDANIFARILRGEIPNRTVLETDLTLAFEDVRPQAPQHVLVIPKGKYVNADHFAADASEAEIVDFTRALATITRQLGVQPCTGGEGYRVIANSGVNSHQEVPHYHIHILAGRPLGRLIERAD